MKPTKSLFLFSLLIFLFCLLISCGDGADSGKAEGAIVGAPTLASKTHNSITIKAVAKPANGQTVEYAKSEANSAPSTGWQDSLVFSGLNGGTTYYIFARSKENADYNAGIPSSGLTASTDSQINMTTTVSGGTSIYLLGTGEATIDWGDGASEEVTLTSSNDVSDLWTCNFDHTYNGSGSEKTLTVIGNVTGFAGCPLVSALNVSGCPGLKFLDCNGEFFTVLDLSKNTALVRLYCNINQLTTLDLSKNTKLVELVCDNNQLTALDLSKNTALEYLDCWNNQLTSLDITGCNALEEVYCNDNDLDDAALNAVLYALPDRSSLATNGYIDVQNNPGVSIGEYDNSIATVKNWAVVE